jgi:hypothetical protein
VAWQSEDHRPLILEVEQAVGQPAPRFAAIGEQDLARKHGGHLYDGFPIR